jgi:hypothetical protein
MDALSIQENNYPSNCNRSLFIYFFQFLILDAPQTVLSKAQKMGSHL